jgi:hypothetical protein
MQVPTALRGYTQQPQNKQCQHATPDRALWVVTAQQLNAMSFHLRSMV